MRIELTTRQLVSLLKDAYKIGAQEQPKDNIEGRADDTARKVIMDNLHHDDFTIQQT